MSLYNTDTMLKCPYCYEKLPQETNHCPHCDQYIIDDVLNSDFPSLEKKKCVFCGKKVLQEARFCKHCHQWLDELDQTIQDIDWED